MDKKVGRISVEDWRSEDEIFIIRTYHLTVVNSCLFTT